jgi:hypothetical protein
MPIFKVSARDGSVTLLIRARCISCAREVAVEEAGGEGTIVWRNPELSTVELVRNPEQIGLDPEGVRAVLKRENQ